MDTFLDSLGPGEVAALLFAVILAAAGAVNTIGSAVEKILKGWKAARAPNDEQDRRIGALEEWRETVDDKLGHDKKELESIHAGNQAMYKALLALLDHGIDGNNIAQMQDAKGDLYAHLTEKL